MHHLSETARSCTGPAAAWRTLLELGGSSHGGVCLQRREAPARPRRGAAGGQGGRGDSCPLARGESGGERAARDLRRGGGREGIGVARRQGRRVVPPPCGRGTHDRPQSCRAHGSGGQSHELRSSYRRHGRGAPRDVALELPSWDHRPGLGLAPFDRSLVLCNDKRGPHLCASPIQSFLTPLSARHTGGLIRGADFCTNGSFRQSSCLFLQAPRCSAPRPGSKQQCVTMEAKRGDDFAKAPPRLAHTSAAKIQHR